MNGNLLVGCTGFVGGNLYESGAFACGFHSTHILQAYGTRPALLVYAGVRAEKYLANSNPEKDRKAVEEAFAHIRSIAPQRLVLISTIDVFGNSAGADEGISPEMGERASGTAYGCNRYHLECLVREAYPDALIVRLPALYGKGIKKNFLYDCLHPVPGMLRKEKYQELAGDSALIHQAYMDAGNGFYSLSGEVGEQELKSEFLQMGFRSLCFTDDRSRFQFYPLRLLWQHIQIALEARIRLLHLAVEPISAGELYEAVYGEVFHNRLSGRIAAYDFRSRYAALFGGRNGYLLDRSFLIPDIRRFLQEQERKLIETSVHA